MSTTTERQIREAYEVACEQAAVKPGGFVRLSQVLCLVMADRDDVVSTLEAMSATGYVHLATDTNRKAHTAADRQHAVMIGDQPKMLIAIEEAPAPEVTTRKLSAPMTSTLRQVALYGSVGDAKANTIAALSARGLIVQRGAVYQVTADGARALPTDDAAAHEVGLAMHAEALATHESTQDAPRKPHNPNMDDPFGPFDTDDDAPEWTEAVPDKECPICGHVAPQPRDTDYVCTECGATVLPNNAAVPAAEPTEPTRERLAPMTSVVVGAAHTGRVLSDDGEYVYVRFHDESPMAPSEGRGYRRHAVRTVADLWESIEDTARAQIGLHEPCLFWVSEHWAGAGDPDCRYIPWRDYLTSERQWAPLDVGDDDTHEYVRFVMLASYGDYSDSSTVDASNYMVVRSSWFDDMPDPLLYEVGPNERDGQGVAARIGDPRWNITQLAELESTVSGLATYPIIDEMHLSAYELGLQEEWWNTDGLSDLKIDIDDHFDAMESVVDSNGNLYTWETAALSADLPYTADDREELLSAVFFDAADEWRYDTPTSASPHDVDAVTAHVIATVYAAHQSAHYGPVWTGEADVWLTDADVAAYAQPATDRNQLPLPLSGVSCERCGRELTPLDNGTYRRHTDPATARHCHASGQRV